MDTTTPSDEPARSRRPISATARMLASSAAETQVIAAHLRARLQQMEQDVLSAQERSHQAQLRLQAAQAALARARAQLHRTRDASA
ncbi:hypothetical protein [Nocardia huaxiensis]|uniref:Uncharacterized protein n=1 Tax=Nocardia huaxiensis TaxID=2755382 RepID=A0A7D6VGL0_9NOCA|nr:hypothetical protein [Nocardia huaxiensis]QLY29656.1 hypothetical protein H0264_31170 [Nocardia huaxiensis]UFS96770.1 hypothetical protein LPY97_02210 [Nocardia huaxiensis]